MTPSLGEDYYVSIQDQIDSRWNTINTIKRKNDRKKGERRIHKYHFRIESRVLNIKKKTEEYKTMLAGEKKTKGIFRIGHKDKTTKHALHFSKKSFDENDEGTPRLN